MPYAVLIARTIPVSRQRVFAALMDFGGERVMRKLGRVSAPTVHRALNVLQEMFAP